MATPHSCLRKLSFDNYQFDMEREATRNLQNKNNEGILRLLDIFPELGCLSDDVAKNFPDVIERMDLNRCSGMLLRGAVIPLSVWAVVLAKVNTDPYSGKSRKANVIYHMLHGPVFEGRGPVRSETDHTASLSYKHGGQSELPNPSNKKHKS